MDLIGLRIRTSKGVEGSCEHGNDISSSIKCGAVLGSQEELSAMEFNS
jgi:hypothetical protein